MDKFIFSLLAILMATSIGSSQTSVESSLVASGDYFNFSSSNSTNKTLGDFEKISAQMVWVNGGIFKTTSGSKKNEMDCSIDTKPEYEVKLDGYYLSKYEVSVAEFEAFVNSTGYLSDAEKTGFSRYWTGVFLKNSEGMNWRHNASGELWKDSEKETHPVVNVSWNDAVEYCNWLSKETGKEYRLPAEAEWEYAAKGGENSKGYVYSGSNNLNEIAWYKENSSDKIHPVGAKQANELGVYDLNGNVREWCSDWYAENNNGKAGDIHPKGSEPSMKCVVRGDSWASSKAQIRITNRGYHAPDERFSDCGFRIALSK